ncbi:hypothetical protein C8R45DRAFT_541707 [Mycena sanguinolenta]|nr:hypothetical protein C8R45DRAFT_541707 [Mycena sanguinolenta]
MTRGPVGVRLLHGFALCHRWRCLVVSIHASGGRPRSTARVGTRGCAARLGGGMRLGLGCASRRAGGRGEDNSGIRMCNWGAARCGDETQTRFHDSRRLRSRRRSLPSSSMWRRGDSEVARHDEQEQDADAATTSPSAPGMAPSSIRFTLRGAMGAGGDGGRVQSFVRRTAMGWVRIRCWGEEADGVQ